MRDLSQILHADIQTNCHKTMSQIFDIIPKILSHINHTYCTSLQELLPAERREEEAGDPALSEEHAPPERRTLPPLRIRKGTGNGAAKRRSDGGATHTTASRIKKEGFRFHSIVLT